jgi:prolyl 4-hydroxylase
MVGRKQKWWIAAGSAALAVAVVLGIAYAARSDKNPLSNIFPKVLTETFYEFADGSKVCNRVFFFEIDDFLTRETCDRFMSEALAHDMHDSKVGESQSALDMNVRKSTQTWFKHEENEIAKYIKKRVSEVMTNSKLAPCFAGVSADKNFEDVQVVRYSQSGKYDPHFDATECGNDIGVQCVQKQRIATVLIYLNDDFEGGTTRFPNLNVTIEPKKGKALFFWVSDKDSRLVYNETLHGGDPVTRGEKWIATQWIRAP